MRDGFWQRLLIVLRSRRVLGALAGVLVTVIVMWVPELEAVQDELMTVIMSVLLVGLGGASAYNRLRVRELEETVQADRLADDESANITEQMKGDVDADHAGLP